MSVREPEPVSRWAIGFVAFAGAIMIMVGIFDALAGLSAIVKDDLFVVTRNYVFDLDVTVWGWIHMILGIVVALAGGSVFTGALWARTVGITLALLSAIANFFLIPYYPFWSLLIIALDVMVIWALSVYGRREASAL